MSLTKSYGWVVICRTVSTLGVQRVLYCILLYSLVNWINTQQCFTSPLYWREIEFLTFIIGCCKPRAMGIKPSPLVRRVLLHRVIVLRRYLCWLSGWIQMETAFPQLAVVTPKGVFNVILELVWLTVLLIYRLWRKVFPLSTTWMPRLEILVYLYVSALLSLWTVSCFQSAEEWNQSSSSSSSSLFLFFFFFFLWGRRSPA
jgi:hypothetical protein